MRTLRGSILVVQITSWLAACEPTPRTAPQGVPATVDAAVKRDTRASTSPDVAAGSGADAAGMPQSPDAAAANLPGMADAAPAGASDAASMSADTSPSPQPPAAMDGPGGASRCAGSAAPFCLDFEDGLLPPGWTMNKKSFVPAPLVDGTRPYRGRYSLHFPLKPRSAPPTGTSVSIWTTGMNGLTTDVHGRAWVFLQGEIPAAEYHGWFVQAATNAVNDVPPQVGGNGGKGEAGFWKQKGVAFNGNASASSEPAIMMVPTGQWFCLQWSFKTGAAAKMSITNAAGKTETSTARSASSGDQFRRIDIGFVAYHATSAADQEFDLWYDAVLIDGKPVSCSQ